MKFPFKKLDSHFLNSSPAFIKTRVSQELWYLQIVSDKNLYLDEINKLFLLPYNSIFGIQHLIVPPYVQRLDPLIKDSTMQSNLFPAQLPEFFPCGMISSSVLFENIPNDISKQIKLNYYLDLHKTYEELYSDFNNGHKLNLKQAYKQKIKVRESKNISLFVEHYSRFCHSDIPARYKNKNMLSQLISECLNRNAGFILNAENNKEEVLASAFFTEYKNRLVYLLSSSSPEGKKHFAMYTIIDELIKRNCKSQKILDFEGSMIPGIAYFMKGFGSEFENYYIYEWNKHWICTIKQKLKNIFS